MSPFDYEADVRLKHDEGAPEALLAALNYENVGSGHACEERVGPLDTLGDLAEAGWRLVRVGQVPRVDLPFSRPGDDSHGLPEFGDLSAPDLLASRLEPCPKCVGDGGWWEYDHVGDGNLEPARVVDCDRCDGSGVDPSPKAEGDTDA